MKHGGARVIAVTPGFDPSGELRRWMGRRRAVLLRPDRVVAGLNDWTPARRMRVAMDHQQLVKLSKRMSKALRHDPARVGLTLDPGGWVPVEAFLSALGIYRSDSRRGRRRQRQAALRGGDGARRGRADPCEPGPFGPGRAGLVPQEPPEVLFHGTGAAAVPSIQATGLNRGGRHHVHLSPDTAPPTGSAPAAAAPSRSSPSWRGEMARAGHVVLRAPATASGSPTRCRPRSSALERFRPAVSPAGSTRRRGRPRRRSAGVPAARASPRSASPSRSAAPAASRTGRRHRPRSCGHC